MRGELRCHVACCTECSIVKHVEIFPDCTRRLSRINRAGVPFDARRGALLVGIRRDQAGINRKVLAALTHDLVPILCVGETDAERDRGVTYVVVDRQVKEALKDVAETQLEKIVVAYEPIWAIGTGRTATPAQAEEVHQSIRGQLAKLFSADAAETVPILYGGSVKPDNVDDLMAEADIDGALVGGASLKADSFNRICGFERRT